MPLHDRLSGTAAPRPALRDRLGGDDTNTRDRFSVLRARVNAACVEHIGPQLQELEELPEALLERVREVTDAVVGESNVRMTADERAALYQDVVDDVLGYGPIEPFLHDPRIAEIMVNGPQQIYVERAGRLEHVRATFVDERHLLRVIDRIVSTVGRRVDESSPMVDARLADGSRVNVVLPPLALSGATLTIRKFSPDILGVDDLVARGTLTEAAASFLEACVRGKLNVLISGGTGVGKTTLLNTLSGFVPEHERIITIEDAAELRLRQRHVVSLEARPANVEGQGEIRIKDIVRNALRMRPDRIIVGEVRGAETLDMLQAMNTGHDGSLSTIHANAPRDALSRLETLVLTAGVDLPLRAIREQVASAFDLVIQIARFVDGTRRVTHITEVAGMQSDVVALQELFVAGPAGEPGAYAGRLRATGIRPGFVEKLSLSGVELPLLVAEVVP